MKLAIGCDNNGYVLKETLKRELLDAGHEVIDVGAHVLEAHTIDEAPVKVAQMVAAGEAERGILIDATGAASAIIANKVRGIRAAQVGDYYSARMTKAHNDANILCLGAGVVGSTVASACVKVWLETEVMGGNHPRRIEMIHQLEEKYAK